MFHGVRLIWAISSRCLGSTEHVDHFRSRPILQCTEGVKLADSIGVPPKERFCCAAVFCHEGGTNNGGLPMHGLIYLIGLIVVIMFILSLLGLR